WTRVHGSRYGVRAEDMPLDVAGLRAYVTDGIDARTGPGWCRPPTGPCTIRAGGDRRRGSRMPA
ncbi:MAG: hypothetical protein ACRDYZ_07290, partial [Acidimicrobiales bacterium]